ncbi:hypothetical protein MTO96_003304 [Rhipicephalus appendiculatus]
MKLAIILGLVSLTVFPKEGLCKRIHQKLNLTEVAEKYLGERFGENLESWSLTEVPRLPEEPAVKGTVQPFQYDANITALYKSKEHTFQFNLSDASSATWNPENLTEPINFTAAVMKWECEFRAEVDFKGWLAYTLRVERAILTFFGTYKRPAGRASSASQENKQSRVALITKNEACDHNGTNFVDSCFERR